MEQEQYKLLKEIDRLSTISLELSEQVDIVRTMLTTEITIVKILEDPKILNAKGDSTNLIVLVFAMILGLVLGIVVATIKELYSGVIGDEIVYRRIFGNDIPILEILPTINTRQNWDVSFVVLDYPNSIVSKAYNRLAGIIQSMRVSENKKVYCFFKLQWL